MNVSSKVAARGLSICVFRSGIIASAAFGLMSASRVSAATWDGAPDAGGTSADANWMTGTNWVGDTAPTASNTTDLSFAGTTNTTNNNNYAANSAFRSLGFASTAGVFTLNGNAINLGGAAAVNVIDNLSSTNQVINLGLNLTGVGDLRLNPGAGHTVTLGGTVAFAGQRFYLPSANVSAGTIVFNGTNTGLGNGNAFYNLPGATMRSTVYNATAGMTIVAGSTNAFGASSATGLQFNQDTTLQSNKDLSGANALLNSIANGGGRTLTISGSNNLQVAGNYYAVSANNSTIAVTNTAATTISGNVFLTEQTGGSTRTTTINVSSASGGFTISGNIANNSVAGNTDIGAITKATGTGTLRLSGTNTYTGATTVTAGTLLINGTQSQGTGANVGKIVTSAGTTLGGTGTVNLSDTNGGGTGISVSGTFAPGDGGIGTFTTDDTNSARSALAFETGSTLLYDLGAGLTADKFALTGGKTNGQVFFNNNTINFNDLTAGSLQNGQYVLFSGSAGANFAGLGTDASGTITSGLTIGSGVSGYTTSLQFVGTNIVLNVAATPEPASLGLVGGAAALFAASPQPPLLNLGLEPISFTGAGRTGRPPAYCEWTDVSHAARSKSLRSK